MKSITKLFIAITGFGLSLAASSNPIKASNQNSIAPAKECHGSGTCFTTPGGTVINGQWVEVPK